jgi:RNA polymerase sigma-70 factor (ECF subfamily)
MLYYFERYSVREIGALLDLPEGTVHSRLSRARDQLRKELPDYER